MKRVALSLVLAASVTASSAMAADMATKAPPPAPAPAPSPWDIAITAALMNDYMFRGVTQSAHKPSVQGGFEARYNFSKDWQGYVGLSGESIDFPNRAAAEIDVYGGIRPTFDKLALDFGFWEYYYPGGQCFNAGAPPFVPSCAGQGIGPISLPNGNVAKADWSFWEVYAKGTYTVNDNLSFGGQFYYSPSVLNTGAPGEYYAGTITLTAPSSWFPADWGGYISADAGYWQLGTSDSFYGTGIAGNPFASGVKYTSYWNWDVGGGWTYKAFTLDLRWYDSNLTKAECNVFTSDQTATFNRANITTQNPGGLGSNWCGSTYVAKLSFATNLSSLK